MKTISHLFFALAVMAYSVIATSLKAPVLASPNATGVCQPSSLDLTKVTYFNDNGKNSAQAWGDHVDMVNAYFTYDGQAPELITENMMWKNVSEVVDIPTAPNGLEYIPLSSLDLSKTSCGWGTPKQNQSIDGNALIIDGTAYSSGVGTHSPSQIIVKLNGSVTEFHAVLGIDDEVTSYGNFDYRVYLKAEDGTVKDVASGTIDRTSIKSADLHVDVNGWKYLYLETSNGLNDNWGDHVDWANAYFAFKTRTLPDLALLVPKR